MTFVFDLDRWREVFFMPLEWRAFKALTKQNLLTNLIKVYWRKNEFSI